MKKFLNRFNIFATPRDENGAPKPLPVIGKLSVRSQYMLLLAGVAIGGAVSLTILQYTVERGARTTERIGAAGDIQMFTQRLAKNIQKSVAGDKAAFAQVAKDSVDTDKVLSLLRNGGPSFGKLEADLASSLLSPVENTWGETKKKISTLAAAETEITTLAENADELENKSASFSEVLDNAYLLMIQRGEDDARVGALQSLGADMLRLSKNLAIAARSPKTDLRVAASLNADYTAIRNLVEALTTGNNKYKFTPVSDSETKDVLAGFAKDASGYLDAVNNVISTVKKLDDGKTAGTNALAGLDAIYLDIEALDQTAKAEAAKLEQMRLLVYVLILFASACMLVFIIANKRDTERLAWEAGQQRDASNRERDETDDAVIRLMEELVPISEGNLAARATVTEHVTGALADRINLMAESLQNAVTDTKNASGEVAQTMDSVRDLIRQAASAANNATTAANGSHDASVSGAELVRRAADKMEQARDRMQETSKRVKRLGEVSQSIGSITDLIEGMTEKTAILALNTQLKAAEAGDEGKSFRVIAEEIRKLSDEAKKSLATIRSNVQSMQSETQTVMSSIEQTTVNVVEGSHLWASADDNLARIREAADGIVQITSNLGSISQTQVERADDAENKMRDLQARMSQFTV